VVPDLTADRQRIAAGAGLAVATRHEPPRLELIAPGELPGVAVAVVSALLRLLCAMFLKRPY